MNEHNSVFGPMMRHGETYGSSLHLHDAGPSPIEWAILGLAIAILVIASLLLFDTCQRRRRHRRFWGDQSDHDRPLAILSLRYARGEISRDEYSQVLADLGASQERPAAPADNAETTPEEAQPKRRRGRR